eukprot:CAMPEP_0203937902 /NCGR_PEP_ID=MMETSP0359-20131031/75050_1 /ASSEMBLY_ACC=CAM_ASM_000338 /TAXON_ID=268821 /ORGANISM="Scrippsiella Hangoei, Strain SHTV-5" /LENGTH=127 /DNA_ID=CAMNT_0050868047 /DNA_START=15 /DNA_END=396 /DNA_ORIENTATION=-
MIGRDLCGEFQLLGGVGSLLDSAPNASAGLRGTISLFSSSTPCVSCITALRQFQLRFPDVQLLFLNAEALMSGLEFDLGADGHPALPPSLRSAEIPPVVRRGAFVGSAAGAERGRRVEQDGALRPST